ncbi:MAG: adenylate kinase [Planctomycetes bacterium]|nr:adenylate kinase [Planctomycetota bacterium]
MRIVLLGAPGAGKGTQAKRLAEKFDMLHLSSGDILRAEKAAGSELGKELAKYMDAGKLVPDAVVVGVMAKAISNPAASKGLLLDGFPRTVGQAKVLDAQLARFNTPLDLVVYMDVSADVVVDRICGRRSCPSCGAIYHEKYLRPKVEGACDQCSYTGQLELRRDDTEEVVLRRLDAYKAVTAPVLDYYKDAGAEKVLCVDGNRRPNEVTAEIVAQLQALAT